VRRPVSALCPYTPLFRSWLGALSRSVVQRRYAVDVPGPEEQVAAATRSRRRAARAAREQERLARRQLGVSVRLEAVVVVGVLAVDRKSTRLNSSHVKISY